MKKIKTKFKDLFVVNTRIFKDDRGWLKEEFKKKIVKKNLVFTVVSNSKKNVLRGLHMQTKFKQGKYVSVLKGKILDVAVDCRKKSKTFGKFHKVILSEKNGKSIFIPPGFIHGFLGLEKENIVVYGCTNYRNKNSEIGVMWNDADLKIKWPIKRPIISVKDKNNISFKEFKNLKL